MSNGEKLPTVGEAGRAAFAASGAAVASVVLSGVLQLPRETAAGWVVLAILFGLPIALFHAFVFGLPIYMRLRRRWRLRWWSAMLGGFLVGGLPLILLSLPALLSAPVLPDGLPVTLYVPPLWWRLLLAIVEAGLPGLVGGLTFWLVLRRSGSCR
jgi:hypothetical protein